MKTFQEYAQARMAENVALLLWATDTDVNDFCEAVLLMAQNKSLNEEVLTELGWRNILGGASNIATGLAGLGGGARYVGQQLGRGASAVGSAIGSGVSGATNAVGQGVTNTRDAIAAKYQAGREALGRGASAVGQGINTAASNIAAGANQAWDKTGGAAGRGIHQAGSAVGDWASKQKQGFMAGVQQSTQGEKLRQATNAVQALQQQLSGYGYPPEFLNQALSPLMQALQHDSQANQQTGYKIGSGPYGQQAPAAAPGQTA